MPHEPASNFDRSTSLTSDYSTTTPQATNYERTVFVDQPFQGYDIDYSMTLGLDQLYHDTGEILGDLNTYSLQRIQWSELAQSGAQIPMISSDQKSFTDKRSRSHSSTRSRFSAQAVSILEASLLYQPYPSPTTVKELASSTGLTERQVGDWFSNRRHRRSASIDSTRSSSQSQYDIRDYSSTGSTRGRAKQRSRGHDRSDSCSSMTSLLSQSSGAVLSGPPKRGRKIYSRSSSVDRDAKSGGSQIYWCTFGFCREGPFSDKTWKRHEGSHVRLETWICQPTGPLFVNPIGGRLSCGFCSEAISDGMRACSNEHRAWECYQRPLDARTFDRKDNLKQHFRMFHRASSLFHFESVASAWKRDNSRAMSWVCGFCTESFTDWNIRARHVAKHFREGKSMKYWKEEGRWLEINKAPRRSEATAKINLNSAVKHFGKSGDSFLPNLSTIQSESSTYKSGKAAFIGDGADKDGQKEPVEVVLHHGERRCSDPSYNTKYAGGGGGSSGGIYGGGSGRYGGRVYSGGSRSSKPSVVVHHGGGSPYDYNSSSSANTHGYWR
jgi:hypothetical protein